FPEGIVGTLRRLAGRRATPAPEPAMVVAPTPVASAVPVPAAPRDDGVLLEAHGLTRDFGGLVAVNDVDFRVRQGELRAVIGPNGAGKTTFFNLITGVLPPSRGRIVFKGRDTTRLPAHVVSRLGIARSYQV